MSEPESRRAALLREIEWQENSLKSLEREKRFVPWLALLYLATIPAAMWKGLLGVIVVPIATTIILITAVYIQAQHRSEYQSRLEEMRKSLAALDRRPIAPL